MVSLIEGEITQYAKNTVKSPVIEKIFISHQQILICRGCRKCFDKGENECPLKDDLLFIRDEIFNADALIVSSPVYVEDVNGIMKNWLDRMAFYCHRSAFLKKNAILVTTSGSGSSDHALNTMKMALNTWGFYISGKIKCRTGALMTPSEMKAKYNKKIKGIAKKLVDDFVDQSGEKPTFWGFVVFKVQQRYWQKTINYKDTLDYNYWKDNGWLDSRSKYYFKTQSSGIKITTARFVGSFFSLFFK